MKPIKEITSAAGSYQGLRKLDSGEKNSDSSELHEDHPIWDAWTQIKSAFPGSTVNWEIDPPAIWGHAINDMNHEQVANGIRNLVHFDNNGFPPSAGQFRDLCLTNFDWQERAHKLAFESPPVLEDLTAKEKRVEQGLTEIQKIKEMMGI